MPAGERKRAAAPVVLLGYSVRALAASAHRAGVPCIAMDACADADTRALADQTLQLGADGPPMAPEGIGAALARLGRLDGVVFTGGAEAAVAHLPSHLRVYGNRPETLAEVTDPVRLAQRLDEAGLPRPEQTLAATHPPRAGGGWLYKRIGGGGGVGVTRTPPDGGADTSVAQREHPGRTLGVLFAADGRSAYPIGAHWQWHAPCHPWSPPRSISSPGRFRYGGAVAIPRLPRAVDTVLRRGLDRLVAATGLRGVNSIDVRVQGQDFRVLEVNPRPGLTVDIHDARCQAPLFEIHRDTTQGHPPGITLPLDRPDSLRAHPLYGHAVIYTPPGLERAPAVDWPGWSADRPPPETPLHSGLPLCTVRATGPTWRTVAHRLRSQVRCLLDTLSKTQHSRREDP